MASKLEALYIYGEELKMKIHNKDKMNSSVGGLLTILTLIGLIILTWFVGNEKFIRVVHSPIQINQFQKLIQN
jgi:hypothetical protein